MEGIKSQTNVDDFIGELGGGTLKEKMAHILSEAALGTVLHGFNNKKGKVTLELTIQKVGDNDQVIITHKLAHSIPTKRGKKTEEDITETPMFVGRHGVMTIGQPREDSHGQFSLKQVD